MINITGMPNYIMMILKFITEILILKIWTKLIVSGPPMQEISDKELWKALGLYFYQIMKDW